MPEIRIKIGAAVDQSMRTVFKPLVQAAIDARKQIQKEFSAIAVGMRGGFTEGGRTAKRVFSDTSRAGEDMSRDLARQASQRARVAEQESKREWAAYAREAKRAFADTEKAAQKNQQALSKFADRTSHRATRFLMPNMPIASMAHQAGSEVLRGIGVDTSIEGLIERGKGIETEATKLSNRGHIEGAPGANGQVVASGALALEARGAGKATAVDPREILAAGQAFVGLTGDLDLWRKIMPQVVKETKALGGNQEEAARAAGEFAAHVGDVPNKEKAVLDLMRVAAGQGKIGGVDFSDFAKYAAKAAAPAAMFQGDKAQNIGKLTALAEIAKMHGGASSAAMAFGSIDSFSNTLKKPARLKSIAALIGDKNGQFADDRHSVLKDPLELAKQLIVAGSKDKSGKSGLSSLDRVQSAIGDARSMKAITGLQMTFNEAGGGQKGLDAMNAELKKFSGAIMSNEEIARALAVSLATTESKSELVNQKFESITHGVMEKLLPALDQLQEPALKLAGTLGDLAAWAASNPGSAVVAAITASIARAGLESSLRGALEGVIKKSGANMGTINATVGTATLAVATLALAWDQLVDFKNQNGGWEGVKAFVGAGKDSNDFGFSAIDAEMSRQALARAEEEALKHPKPADAAKPVNGLPASWQTPQVEQPGYGFALPGDKQAPPGAQVGDLKTQMASVHAAIREMHADLKGTLNVRVTNQEQPKAPEAGGRK